MHKTKYFGNWEDLEGVKADFDVADDDVSFPTDDEVLFAEYDTPPYEGNAFVLYRRDGKLWEVNGSHCSCMGLEGQWKPEETSADAIRMRPYITESYKEQLEAALAKVS